MKKQAGKQVYTDLLLTFVQFDTPLRNSVLSRKNYLNTSLLLVKIISLKTGVCLLIYMYVLIDNTNFTSKVSVHKSGNNNALSCQVHGAKCTQTYMKLNEIITGTEWPSFLSLVKQFHFSLTPSPPQIDSFS